MALGTVSNVSAGKPNTTGAVYYGALTATLPTAVSGTLTGFTSVGYISDAGVTNANSRSTDSVKAWGGDTVLNTQTEKTDQFTFTMIEMMNSDVLKIVHGSSNVSGALSTGITVNVNATELDSFKWVIDMVLKGNALKRITIPNAKVIEVAEVAYTDSDAVGYQVTLACEPDSSGNTHYEYIKAASASS